MSSTPKDFSTSRPWGVKTLYSGNVAHDYNRLTANVGAQLVSLKTGKGLKLRRG